MVSPFDDPQPSSGPVATRTLTRMIGAFFVVFALMTASWTGVLCFKVGYEQTLGGAQPGFERDGADEKISALREDVIAIALAGCVATAIACLLGVVAARKWIAGPLALLARSFENLAAGDTRYLGEGGGGYEIGALWRSYGELRRIVLDAQTATAKARAQEEQIESERRRAESEKAEARAQKAEAMRAMVDQVERETNIAVESMIELMDELTAITSDMSGAAGRLGDTTASVSSVSDEALSSMQSASSSTRQLTISIDGVADLVRGAKATSDEAVLASHRASQTIEALSKVTAEIDGVTHLIANITRQTGLLALNAGVAAARAGSEGLGFAIIAREVRLLAERTSEATNRIGDLISQVQGSTVSAVAAVDNIAKAIDRVSRASDNIANAMKDQVSTTKLIAASVDGTTGAVTAVTSQIRDVAAETQGAQAMAEKVESVCSEASAKVRALQKNLVKIVRTSSGIVNRRAHPRYAINGFGTIEVGGQITPIEIVDLSEGGAKLVGEIDPGARTFVLNAPDVGMPLRSQIAFCRDGVIGAKFTISEAERARLRSLLDRIARSGAMALSENAA